MNKRILIADDSMFARMIAREAITHIYPEADIHEVSSGQQVLESGKKDNYQFDWYLLDMNMESPNGMDTARQLMKADVNVSCIALVTGNHSNELQRDASGLGVTYIQKTINPADIDKFIDRLRAFFVLTEAGAKS